MKIITVCSICKAEYMYDPNWEPQYKDMCQDCYERMKERDERGCGLNCI